MTLGNWAKDYVMYPLLKTPLMVKLVDGSLNNLGLDFKDMLVMICAILVVLVAEIMSEQMEISVRTWIARQNLVFRWGLYIIGFFVLITFGLYGADYNAQAFIYGGF